MRSKTLILFFILVLFGIHSLAQHENGCTVREQTTASEENLSPLDPTIPWVMSFAEEFENASLDPSIWRVVTGAPREDGTEQIYTMDNMVFEEGLIKIQSRHEPNTYYWKAWDSDAKQNMLKSGRFDFTSAEISTINKFSYGAFQIRCKIPDGKGSWPAFWTYGDPCWHEIDIFEFATKRSFFGFFDQEKSTSVIDMTIHRDTDCDKGSSNCKASVDSPNYAKEYYTLTALWTPYYINWYCEDILLHTRYHYVDAKGKEPIIPRELNFPLADDYPLTKNPVFPSEEMQIIANLAIQGGRDYPNEESYNMEFGIDYIRFYEQKPCGQDVNINSKEEAGIVEKEWNVVTGKTVSLDNIDLKRNEHLEIFASEKVLLGDNFKTSGYWKKVGKDSVWRGGTYNININPNYCKTATNSGERNELSQIQPFRKAKFRASEKSEMATSVLDNLVAPTYDYRFLKPRNQTPMTELSKGEQKRVWQSFLDEKERLIASYQISIVPNPAEQSATVLIKGNQKAGNLVLNVYSSDGTLISKELLTSNTPYTLSLEDYLSGMYSLEFKDAIGHVLQKTTLMK